MIYIILNDNPRANKLINDFKQSGIIPRDANVEELHLDLDREGLKELILDRK